MKRTLMLLACCSLGLFLCGCHSPVEKPGGVAVFIDGDGQFPPSLVGTWRADRGGWEIVFEPNGIISSAVVSLGRVRLVPGRITTVPMKLGGKGVFKPGQWTVQYAQEQRELIVEITIAHFRTELGDSVVQGQARDFFVGSVSEDGRTWPADRFTFPEYIADTKKYHNYKLPFDPNDNPRESMLFQKVVASE